MKYVYLLGACGSIGLQTLDIIRKNLDEFKVIGMSVGHDLELARKVILEFKPSIISFRYESDLASFKDIDAIKLFGDNGLLEIAKYHKYDNELLINALVGSVGLLPTVKAIEAKKDIALANKETLVIAGDLINELILKNDVKLFPIDSEHSAIWKCLQGESRSEVRRLLITASGGSFRDYKRSELKNVTKEDALKHPNWHMGAKITIDSATMMNKGFEVIEAHHLFKIPYDKIETVLHKESMVHSMVEFVDGSIKAELANPDMRGPIAYALMYPRHIDYNPSYMDFKKLMTLHFEELSKLRYPCLDFAYKAGKLGGLYPVALNASNEAAVRLFLNDKISFLDIEKIIEAEISKDYKKENVTLEEILALDKEIKERILNSYEEESN